jgi:hypothetical protein
MLYVSKRDSALKAAKPTRALCAADGTPKQPE